MPSLKQDSSSSCVMPQMALYAGIIEILTRLLICENMLSCENLVMPVMKTNRRYGLRSFSGA